MSKTSMGLGKIGDKNILFGGRKFRWTFEAKFGEHPIRSTFVKTAARPALQVESEPDYLNAKSWIPGKCQWNLWSAKFRFSFD